MASSSGFTILLRPAQESDVPAINAIHAHYVTNTMTTFALVPSTPTEALNNFHSIHTAGFPFIVALLPSASSDDPAPVVGYIYATQFRPKAGYKHTVEISLYCHPLYTSKGIGSALLTRLLDVMQHPENWDESWIRGDPRKEEGRIRQVIVSMALDPTAERGGWKLKEWYQRWGFVQVGLLKEVGRKFGQWIDSVYLQLSLQNLL